ncbi:MAG: hypothetical protein AB1410_10205 [Acidobacteriota bacterium]
MELSTSSIKKETLNYGFLIRPSSYFRAIQRQLNIELLLVPGITYSIPWCKEDTILIPAEIPEVIKTAKIAEEPVVIGEESINWLKLAESAFKFWDNETDEIWNDL